MKMAARRSVELSFQAYGEAGEPLVILHGLLGSGRNWTTHAKRLGEAFRVFALDLRNHGGSPWAEAMSYQLMADDVRLFIEANDLGPVTLIGHSMGGKTAMRLALDAPSLIEKLVAVDIAPVAYDHSFGGYVEAMRAIDVGSLSSRGAIDQRLSSAVPEAGVRAFLLQNLVRQDQGFAWRANLDVLAEAMPDLMSFPASEDDRFEKPAIFLAGGHSDYVRPTHQAEIQRLFPEAEIRFIADAGHWVHAEQPAAFMAHLQDFLSQ
jgi:pimeloyl-ACP methyl ester carboxylesterase